MADVERFNGGALGVSPDPEGRWTRYSDFEASGRGLEQARLERHEARRELKDERESHGQTHELQVKAEGERDSLRSQIREEYERAESLANSYSVAPPSPLSRSLMTAHRTYADRLQAILDSEGQR